MCYKTKGYIASVLPMATLAEQPMLLLFIYLSIHLFIYYLCFVRSFLFGWSIFVCFYCFETESYQVAYAIFQPFGEL